MKVDADVDEDNTKLRSILDTSFTHEHHSTI